jgi:hypothetical protein
MMIFVYLVLYKITTIMHVVCYMYLWSSVIDTHTLLFTFLTGFRQNQDGYQMVIQLLCLVHKRIELFTLCDNIAAFCTSYNGVNVCVGFSLYIQSDIRGIYNVNMYYLRIVCKATHSTRMVFYSSNPKYKTN